MEPLGTTDGRVALFLTDRARDLAPPPAADDGLVHLQAKAFAWITSHGASFFLNYLGRGEYLTATPGGQMGRVYGRVVVLHLTIIFGSFVVAFLGSPIGALLVLVVLKTAFDLGLHLRERRTSGPPQPRAAAAT